MATMPGRGVFLLSSLIFLLNLALSAPAPSHAGPTTGSRTLFGADPELAEARRLMARGLDRSAIRHARYSVRNSTRTRDRRDAYSILCAMHRNRGELELSLRACDGALALMRRADWRILANRAQTLVLVDRRGEGQESFRAAIEALDAKIRGSWRVPKGESLQLAALHEQLQHARVGMSAQSARQPVASLRR
jgi:hypothetical protein